jgi:hypothetical protein
MGNLRQIEALVFALKGGSPGTEIVFLNQNLAIRPASIVRRFHAHLLGAFAPRLLDPATIVFDFANTHPLLRRHSKPP